MSRDFNTNHSSDSSAPYFEDGLGRYMCPPIRRSHCSTEFDHSAFGSGSSILSTFEPPTDSDVCTGHLMGHFYESIPETQEELEAVIAKLQAVYLYRQGLKALAEERLTPQSSPMDYLTDNGLVLPQTQSLIPTTIPGSMKSIWKMDLDSVPSINRDNTSEIASKSQYSIHQEVLARRKIHEKGADVHHSFDGGNGHQRRKDHRQNSAPVNFSTPQWADASWTLRTKVKSTKHGTGVFLPPHLSRSSVKSEKETTQDQ